MPYADETMKRCQGYNPAGSPCNNACEDGYDFCTSHVPSMARKTEQERSKNLYRLGKFTARVNQHAGFDHVKALNGEIGILRQLMEEMHLECANETELILRAKPIIELAREIGTLVIKCHSVEEKLGGLLDKHQVMTLAERLIDIMVQRIKVPELTPERQTEILKQIVSDVDKVIRGDGNS